MHRHLCDDRRFALYEKEETLTALQLMKRLELTLCQVQSVDVIGLGPAGICEMDLRWALLDQHPDDFAVCNVAGRLCDKHNNAALAADRPYLLFNHVAKRWNLQRPPTFIEGQQKGPPVESETDSMEDV